MFGDLSWVYLGHTMSNNDECHVFMASKSIYGTKYLVVEARVYLYKKVYNNIHVYMQNTTTDSKQDVIKINNSKTIERLIKEIMDSVRDTDDSEIYEDAYNALVETYYK